MSALNHWTVGSVLIIQKRNSQGVMHDKRKEKYELSQKLQYFIPIVCRFVLYFYLCLCLCAIATCPPLSFCMSGCYPSKFQTEYFVKRSVAHLLSSKIEFSATKKIFNALQKHFPCTEKSFPLLHFVRWALLLQIYTNICLIKLQCKIFPAFARVTSKHISFIWKYTCSSNIF